jgi:hypothetical protein
MKSLERAFHDDVLSTTHKSEYHSRFKRVDISVEDFEGSDLPSQSRTDENVKKESEAIQGNRRLIINVVLTFWANYRVHADEF